MSWTALRLFVTGVVGVCLLVNSESAASGQAAKAAQAADKATADGEAAKAKPQTGEEKRARPLAGAVRQKKLLAAPRVELLRRMKVVEGRTTAIRLKHAPAVDASKTLREFLAASGQDETVVVVPDALSNTLLVRASDERIEEIERMVEQLDRPPQMVHIRALIAEVNWDAQRGDEAAPDDAPSDASTAKDAEAMPMGSARVGQGLLWLAAVRRELELSVLDTSEAAENLEEQLRALEHNGRLDILARPQIMTLDNQAAFIQVGERVPRITGTRIESRGQTNQVELENVGLILGVTPRVSAEGTVVMEIDLEMSDLRDDEGVVLSSIEGGPAIHATEVVVTMAQSTVAVASGQTIVLGGMTTKSEKRRVEMVMLVSAEIVSLEGKVAGKK